MNMSGKSERIRQVRRIRPAWEQTPIHSLKNDMKIPLTLRTVLALGAATLLCSADANEAVGQAPVVLRASVNTPNNTITIVGTNFGTLAPKVKFNGVTLPSAPL